MLAGSPVGGGAADGPVGGQQAALWGESRQPHGGRSIRLLIHIPEDQEERKGEPGIQSTFSFPFLIQSGLPVHGVVLTVFSVGLPFGNPSPFC